VTFLCASIIVPFDNDTLSRIGCSLQVERGTVRPLPPNILTHIVCINVRSPQFYISIVFTNYLRLYQMSHFPKTSCRKKNIRVRQSQHGLTKIYFINSVIYVWNTKMAVFYVVGPCSLVDVYQRFGGACCLHHHRPDDRGTWYLWNVSKLYQSTRRYTTQKTAIFVLTSARTSNPTVWTCFVSKKLTQYLWAWTSESDK
jgi:hypothetical protein